MSQSPVHLRPKAKRALNWDAKPPEKPRRVRRWAAGLGERLKAWRRPALRQQPWPWPCACWAAVMP